MTLPAPTYDLTLLLDPQLDDGARAKIVADARAAVEAQGELLRHDEWGERPLAYPIGRKSSAEYHLLQFHVGETALLESLDRSLRITDGVLRFRLIKLRAGVPDAPDMRAGARRATSPPEDEAERSDAGQHAEPSEPQTVAAAAPAAEQA
jgi:small subunit ribosomal protein S6